MKFLHTSDWQLGMPFRNETHKAASLRRARIDVVKQIMALAEKERVDFVIAAGDLFDDNRIDYKVIEEVAAILSSSPVPVYLLPGNHDPLTQDSPYVRCQELFIGNTFVLNREEPVAVYKATEKGVWVEKNPDSAAASSSSSPASQKLATLYPCPARNRQSNLDPTRWIPARQPVDGIRIGVAHGSVDIPKPDDFPIARNATTTRELDYLALGHWHGVKQINDRTWYCGAPESTSFGQPNAGKVLLVEFMPDKDGGVSSAPPRVTERHVARYIWEEMERELHSEADVDALIKELDQDANPQTLLRLRCRGSLPQPQLDRVEQLSSERLFHLKLELSDLMLGDGNYHYKQPLLAEMAAILTAKTGASGDEAEIARRALSRLDYHIKSAGFRKEDI